MEDYTQLKKIKQHRKVNFNKKFSSTFNLRIPKNKRTESNNWNTNKYFRYGAEDQWIAYCSKPVNIEQRYHWNTDKLKTCTYKSTKLDNVLDKSNYQNDSQKIYASMARMYSNVEIPRRYFEDSSQLTNWILDSGLTCHMTL